MTKYPLDSQALEEIARDTLQHDKAQRELISGLLDLLKEGLNEVDSENEWGEDVEKVLSAMRSRRLDYENHRFNQKNGYKVNQNSPYAADETLNNSPASLDHVVGTVLKSGRIDLMGEAQLNAVEASFSEEMGEADIARHFDEQPKRKKKPKKVKNMTLEEINALEKAMDNSSDIYKVSARIKNLARGTDASLTSVGEALCNSYTHVAKSLYDFADTIQDRETKVKLIELIRKSEEMPGQFIAAIKNGVR